MYSVAKSHQRPLPLEPVQGRTHYNLDRSTLEPGHEDTWGTSLLRRFSEPPAYTAMRVSSELEYSTSRPALALESLPQSYGVAGPSSPAVSGSGMHPEFTCEHQYIIKSRGKDWAAVYVWSRANATQNRPLLYTGDDVSGRVSMALGKLGEIQRIEVIVRTLRGRSKAMSLTSCHELIAARIRAWTCYSHSRDA